MSVYKVPQDVEADDKLLGPFSPRQFVYLLVTAGLIGLAWFLFTIFPGLIIIPLPFIIFFGLLALPIRKDQPMEAYFAAIISFNLKPNKRIWQPDGKEHLIEILAPKKPETDRTKGIRQEEAVRRLSYLADIVDSEGWAIKHAVSAREGQSGLNPIDIAEDPILNRNIDNLLAKQEQSRKSEILQNMNTARNLADYSGLTASQIQERTYAVNPMNLYAGRERGFNLQEIPLTPTPEIIQATGGDFSVGQNFGNAATSQPQIPTSNFGQTQQFPPAPNFVPNLNPQFSPNTAPTSSQIIEETLPQLNFNPYPEGVRQSVIQPILQQNPPRMDAVSGFIAKQNQGQIQPTPSTTSSQNYSANTTGQTSTSPAPIPEATSNPKASFPQFFPQTFPQVSQAEKVKAEILHQQIEKIVEDGKDLTVEQLAKQAERQEKRLEDEEVVIKLR